jgi:hypothetical protein
VTASDQTRKLTTDERAALWSQYARVHGAVQDTFDSTVRALAAGGIAVTVTLATAAVDDFNGWGVLAVLAFLGALGCHVGSFVTAQRDMRARLALVRVSDLRAFDETSWTRRTFELNVGAGLLLILGGLLLALFVWSVT